MERRTKQWLHGVRGHGFEAFHPVVICSLKVTKIAPSPGAMPNEDTNIYVNSYQSEIIVKCLVS